MIAAIGAMGALGACARYFISSYHVTKNIDYFPRATFLVNILGSFILGSLISFYEQAILSEWLWYLFGVGFLGAFTTFSTFSYEWIIYMREKQYVRAISYVFISLVVGIVAAYLAYWIFKL
ncbi:fluoride efflux transporter CrcB [Paenibacillus endoradicis]|uniref:fluoride efflux transporter CrcB n=1 Tax=Paenibacillus endoradicis TaxID=2972487 RepID=UPI002158A329|nr:fluoride efflux transporter CrcB [Paenibacillus endoradicis]MCR8656721.1 fluoride efflux transporter CrcB [Paenibacillus endoradicis]